MFAPADDQPFMINQSLKVGHMVRYDGRVYTIGVFVDGDVVLQGTSAKGVSESFRLSPVGLVRCNRFGEEAIDCKSPGCDGPTIKRSPSEWVCEVNDDHRWIESWADAEKSK